MANRTFDGTAAAEELIAQAIADFGERRKARKGEPMMPSEIELAAKLGSAAALVGIAQALDHIAPSFDRWAKK